MAFSQIFFGLFGSAGEELVHIPSVFGQLGKVLSQLVAPLGHENACDRLVTFPITAGVYQFPAQRQNGITLGYSDTMSHSIDLDGKGYAKKRYLTGVVEKPVVHKQPDE